MQECYGRVSELLVSWLCDAEAIRVVTNLKPGSLPKRATNVIKLSRRIARRTLRMAPMSLAYS